MLFIRILYGRGTHTTQHHGPSEGDSCCEDHFAGRRRQGLPKMCRQPPMQRLIFVDCQRQHRSCQTSISVTFGQIGIDYAQQGICFCWGAEFVSRYSRVHREEEQDLHT